ncbi:glycosyltransferase family 2 protein [Planococcus wigleyi]|uniref:Glycosyltransferase family 2 protein n=1 Tax=Planococcus wigleyi TaxID=2762216 RepID=A0ABR8W8M5_9BACL|nr:glycosyltransferase family 2 protein [Planococcus wigleyi]MBD8013366.1 glycosyltransferase family 2 protein [Planococcus wigleyi]
MEKDYPLVSVIIPTYNRPITLKRTIESVLKQTYKNIEIIVVDDNDPNWKSRLETQDIMFKFQEHQNISYVQHTSNKNGSAARNTGFKCSKGEYIMFLDDDDEFLPEKVYAQLTHMEKLDSSWGVSYTNYIRKRNNNIVVYGAEYREGNMLKDELMRNFFIHAGSNLMIRRSVVQDVNGFDESFSRNQDIEFLSRILMKYKIAHVNVIGLVVHVHDNSAVKEQFEDITKKYIDKFLPFINKLTPADKKDFYTMINLQLFRNYITTAGKRSKAWKQILNNDVSIFLVLKYAGHLINRRLRKKAYGFNL